MSSGRDQLFFRKPGRFPLSVRGGVIGWLGLGRVGGGQLQKIDGVLDGGFLVRVIRP
jgi:hypothetical protein